MKIVLNNIEDKNYKIQEGDKIIVSKNKNKAIILSGVTDDMICCEEICINERCVIDLPEYIEFDILEDKDIKDYSIPPLAIQIDVAVKDTKDKNKIIIEKSIKHTFNKLTYPKGFLKINDEDPEVQFIHYTNIDQNGDSRCWLDLMDVGIILETFCLENLEINTK